MKRGFPFGLSGAPSTFQRMMTVIFGDSQYKKDLYHLDDILIWGRNWEEHMSRFRVVLEKIKIARVILSPRK